MQPAFQGGHLGSKRSKREPSVRRPRRNDKAAARDAAERAAHGESTEEEDAEEEVDGGASGSRESPNRRRERARCTRIAVAPGTYCDAMDEGEQVAFPEVQQSLLEVNAIDVVQRALQADMQDDQLIAGRSSSPEAERARRALLLAGSAGGVSPSGSAGDASLANTAGETPPMLPTHPEARFDHSLVVSGCAWLCQQQAAASPMQLQFCYKQHVWLQGMETAQETAQDTEVQKTEVQKTKLTRAQKELANLTITAGSCLSKRRV